MELGTGEVAPPTELSTLESLPLDTQKKIALDLPYETVISFCKVSRKLKRVCNDIYFWKDYLKIKIPVHVSIPETADIDWYKRRILEYPSVIKLVTLIENRNPKVKYIRPLDKNWDIFEMVENLQEINCSGGNLTSLPYMPNLETLVCMYNLLTSIPLIHGLKTLECDSNMLTSLPVFPNLTNLDCSNNNIILIPLMTKLKQLNCNYNQLTSFPSFPGLQKLNCSYNQLTSVPLMPNLRVLNCENNPLPGFTLVYWRGVWNKES